MGNIKKLISASLVFALVLVAGAIVLGKDSVSAQELVQENNNQQSEGNEDASSQSQTYSYTAQPGDSYSLIARKAIQTYGITNKVNLSEAQIIFAETNLTQAAGSPVLLQGQKVEIKEATVKEWADKAEDLNAQQQAAWNVYAVRANFNTDKVGQSS